MLGNQQATKSYATIHSSYYYTDQVRPYQKERIPRLVLRGTATKSASRQLCTKLISKQGTSVATGNNAELNLVHHQTLCPYRSLHSHSPRKDLLKAGAEAAIVSACNMQKVGIGRNS